MEGSSSQDAGSSHLTYPVFEPERKEVKEPTGPRQTLKDRLYVGNLHPTVDEYTLLQVFSKFGKVTKLDYLFHKSGPLKGKPRGYAFVEYGSQVDATKALAAAHDKPLRGRKLTVTFAHQAPLDQAGNTLSGGKHRRGMMEVARPTTLSMLKTGFGGRREGTEDKIAIMEAKLRQMEASKAEPMAPHDSLPAKPIPPSTSHLSQNTVRRPSSQSKAKASTSLPSLPLVTPPSDIEIVPKILPFMSAAASSHTKTGHGLRGLAGVKLKPKAKEHSASSEASKPTMPEKTILP